MFSCINLRQYQDREFGSTGAKTIAAIASSMARINDKARRVKGRSTTARFMQLSTKWRQENICPHLDEYSL
ncbi:MAG: hypothetical protein KKC21_07190 [Nitrospinae bacterium]|nr:hypothetical protein [Nitrospinota bacterium]